MRTERVLIVDADLIAYQYAAANEKRTILAKHLKSGREKIFKTRTELKTLLKEKNMEFKPEDYEIEDVQTAASVRFALRNIKSVIQRLTDHTWADKVELYLGTGKTFRHDLALPTPYKDNRDDLINHFTRQLEAMPGFAGPVLGLNNYYRTVVNHAYDGLIRQQIFRTSPIQYLLDQETINPNNQI
jgi:hypothetical protein